MSFKSGGVGDFASKNGLPRKWALLLCVCSFCVEMFLTNRMRMMPGAKGISRTSKIEVGQIKSEDLNPEFKDIKHESNNIDGEVSMVQQAIQEKNKRLADLKEQIAVARFKHNSMLHSDPVKGTSNASG